MGDNSKITPKVEKLDIGNTAVFACLSSKETIWFFSKINTDPIYCSDPLFINPVHMNNTGYYYCYGKYRSLLNELVIDTPVQYQYFISKTLLKVYGKATLL